MLLSRIGFYPVPHLSRSVGTDNLTARIKDSAVQLVRIQESRPADGLK